VKCAQRDGTCEHTLVGMPVQVWGGCMWQVLPCRLYEVPRRHEERLPLVSVCSCCLSLFAGFCHILAETFQQSAEAAVNDVGSSAG